MVKTRPVKRQFFVPYNGKIADIIEDDTDKHTLDLAAALGETRKIIAVELKGGRVTGTGAIYTYANEGDTSIFIDEYGRSHLTVIKDGTQRLQYCLTVANDYWYLYCLGYVVEA